MAVFYPKNDITIKKDEKIILHNKPSRQDITKIMKSVLSQVTQFVMQQLAQRTLWLMH